LSTSRYLDFHTSCSTPAPTRSHRARPGTCAASAQQAPTTRGDRAGHRPTPGLDHRHRLRPTGGARPVHRWQTVTVHVAETTLAIELDHGETRVIRRTTTTAVRNIKADRPRTAPSVS
jgi:hypothetical protein